MVLVKENKNGFTLVELLIVMTIIALLMMAAIGIINPIALTGKARDSKRKENLEKMKIAFEEYFNDNGNYPNMTSLEQCNDKANCGKPIDGMSGYLNSCLCDLQGNPYRLVLDTKWFKVITNLENKNDDGIPKDWYKSDTYTDSPFKDKKDSVNYGVSSSNILWYENVAGSGCDSSRCIIGDCQQAGELGCSSRRGEICHQFNASNNQCGDPQCKVSCCGAGCD